MFWRAYVDRRESSELSIVRIGCWKRTAVTRRERNANQYCGWGQVARLSWPPEPKSNYQTLLDHRIQASYIFPEKLSTSEREQAEATLADEFYDSIVYTPFGNVANDRLPV